MAIVLDDVRATGVGVITGLILCPNKRYLRALIPIHATSTTVVASAAIVLRIEEAAAVTAVTGLSIEAVVGTTRPLKIEICKAARDQERQKN
jgi:hypothetical protein